MFNTLHTCCVRFSVTRTQLINYFLFTHFLIIGLLYAIMLDYLSTMYPVTRFGEHSKPGTGSSNI